MVIAPPAGEPRSSTAPPHVSGDAVSDFERAFARLVGAEYAVAFGYGRTAIGVAVRELIGNGRLALSPLTCRVVPAAVLWSGARPRYGDTAEGGLNMDPRSAPQADAVLFQHTYGSRAGLESFLQRDVPVLEDRAQCAPVRDDWGGAPHGIAGVYSMGRMKPLSAGAGGVLVTDDPALAADVRRARDGLKESSATRRFASAVFGWAERRVLTPRRYWKLLAVSRLLSRPSADPVADAEADAVRLSDGQARRALAALATADAAAQRRAECAARVRDDAAALGIDVVAYETDAPLYVPVRVKEKRALLERAARRAVEIVPWPDRTMMYGVETQEELAAFGCIPERYPRADAMARTLVGLPVHERIDARERERIRSLLDEHGRSA